MTRTRRRGRGPGDGSPWRMSSALTVPVAEDVAVDRRGQQGVARHPDLVGVPRRAEDAEVRLGGRLVGAGGAPNDRDLVDDDVRAPHQRADPERAGREHRDQRRDGDPSPLAPVQPAQHEVVHGPDEDDVAEEEHEQPAERRQGEAGQVGDRGHDLASRPTATSPRPSGRAGAAARAACPTSRPSASQLVVGSKPSSVTEPLPTLRSAAMTRSPDWASDRPAPGRRHRP